MQYLIDIIAFMTFSIVLSLCLAILFRTPRRHLIYAVSIGVISSSMFRYMSKEYSHLFSVAATAFVVATIAQLLARRTQSPSQSFIIPGVIFLVPGLSILNAIESLKLRNGSSAEEHLYTALAVAFTISFSILVANWLIPSRRDL
ncbi:MAG: threonine/serine exporter family protein [Bdellovibrionota bacterium]